MLRPEAESGAASVSIFVVIVLYKMAPSQSSTYRLLLQTLPEIRDQVRVEVLLYDNTPGESPGAMPGGFHYIASPANSGLSTAYNVAMEFAARGGFEWLLTLDQDTVLSETFLGQFAAIAAEQQADKRVAAIVPRLYMGEEPISPNWFKAGMFPRSFPEGYQGLPDKAVYAFNSGSLVRVSALRHIGGYSPLFWLDNSDTYLYRKLEIAGLRVFVAGGLQLQHDFSMKDIKNKMSMKRYRDSLESGSAFWDMEMNWVQGVEQTTRLVRLYFSQIYRKRDSEIRRITLSVICNRLIRSKKRRLRDWLTVQHARIASYESATAEQPR